MAQNAIAAGSGHLEVSYFEPKVVFQCHPNAEVPKEQWAKEFVRSIVAGVEATAEIGFSKGEEKNSTTSGCA